MTGAREEPADRPRYVDKIVTIGTVNGPTHITSTAFTDDRGNAIVRMTTWSTSGTVVCEWSTPSPEASVVAVFRQLFNEPIPSDHPVTAEMGAPGEPDNEPLL